MDKLMKQAEDHLAKCRAKIATDEEVLGIKRIKELAEVTAYDVDIDIGSKVYSFKEQHLAAFVAAALSSNAAQSEGQEPVCKVIDFGHNMRAVATLTGEFPPIGTLLYTHPSSAAQVEEIQNAEPENRWFDLLEVLVDMYDDCGKPEELRTYIYGAFEDQMKEIKALIEMDRAMKTAAPSKGKQNG